MRQRRMGISAVLCVALSLSVLATACGSAAGSGIADRAVLSAVPAMNAGDDEALYSRRTQGPGDYIDVGPDTAWYRAIAYSSEQGWFQGLGAGLFRPEDPVDRAAVVTVLSRMAGAELPADPGGFRDVGAGDWYAGAAAWAREQGIVEGETFGPREQVTRAELARLLYAYAGAEGDRQTGSGALGGYRDGAKVAEADQTAVSWAVNNGIYGALVVDTIQPGLAVSRGELAQVLVGLASHGGDPAAREIVLAQRKPPVDSPVRRGHDQIQQAVEASAQRYGAISIQVAVVEDGTVTDTFATGWSTRAQEMITRSDGTGGYVLVEMGDPMTADHKVRVASISKVAIGMVAMAMAEEGIIDLDESIGTYWGCTVRNPYYPNDPITIRSLLTHTSSIFMAGDDVSRQYAQVYARLSQGTGFSRVVPGSIYSWGYNNYGFGVLGMTLELAADQTMDELLDRYFFRSLDIDGAFMPGHVRDADRLVTLYEHDGSVARSVEYQRRDIGAVTPGATGTYFAGGLTISASDMGKLVAVLANDGVYQNLRLLEPESVETMETRSEITVGDGFYQCLPLRSQDQIYGRDRLYYHTGSAYGVYHCMSYDPDTGDGLVVLTTGASAARDQYGIYAVCGAINQAVYDITK